MPQRFHPGLRRLTVADRVSTVGAEAVDAPIEDVNRLEVAEMACRDSQRGCSMIKEFIVIVFANWFHPMERIEAPTEHV